MCDPDDEPLEFCPDSGFPGAEPSFSRSLQAKEFGEIADVIRGLPPDFIQNRMRLGFDLWCLGRIFENEIAEVAAVHGLGVV